MNSLHRNIKMSSLTAVSALAIIVLFAALIPVQGQIPTPTVLYGFQQLPTDVISPSGPIAQGRDGNLYGTGTNRGANNRGGVWKITPSGTETLLASFPATWTNCQGLTLGLDGNFYGACQRRRSEQRGSGLPGDPQLVFLPTCMTSTVVPGMSSHSKPPSSGRTAIYMVLGMRAEILTGTEMSMRSLPPASTRTSSPWWVGAAIAGRRLWFSPMTETYTARKPMPMDLETWAECSS